MDNLFANIKAVTFDIDDTLYDFESVNQHATSAVITELKKIAPENLTDDLTVESIEGIRESIASELFHLRDEIPHWLRHVQDISMQRLAQQMNLDSKVMGEHLVQIWYEQKDKDIELYEETHWVLEHLAQKYKIGLLSNGATSLAHAPCHEFFSSQVRSHQHGFSKPDSRLFHKAATELNVLPHEILHVGDHLHDDVHGAQLAGMKGIWINRKNLLNTTDIIPDATITSLDQLLTLLNFQKFSQAT